MAKCRFYCQSYCDGSTFLKVQLKGRLTFDKKYEGKNIFIAFPYENDWYLFDHDEVLKLIVENIKETSSWKVEGGYSWKHLSRENIQLLEKYKLQPSSKNEYLAKNFNE